MGPLLAQTPQFQVRNRPRLSRADSLSEGKGLRAGDDGPHRGRLPQEPLVRLARRPPQRRPQ